MKSRHKYENDIPIDDELTVLCLLHCRWGDRTERHISLWPHAPPHVIIEHCHDRSDSDFKQFLVTDRVVQSLRDQKLVRGKPEWGYTDHHEQRISKRGEARLHEAYAVHEPIVWGFSAEHWLERRRWK
jgi:hypothetical protein